jgi:hypothetical protein
MVAEDGRATRRWWDLAARVRAAQPPERGETTPNPAAPDHEDAFRTLFGAAAVSLPEAAAIVRPPERELLCQITFGKGGNDANYLGTGWSGDESGHRWTLGSASEIWLENPGPGRSFRLELDVYPFCRPPTLPSQRLVVKLRGAVIARSVLAVGRPLAFALPAELLAPPGPLRLMLQHEDAAAPSDFGGGDDRKVAFGFRRLSLYRVNADTCGDDVEAGRGLSIAEMEQATGLPAAAFMLQFESLGDNCEFGLVQRRCGAEPIGLLRFSNINLPNLLRALQTRFAGLGAIENLEFFLGAGTPREYAIREKAFSLVYHTWQKEGEVDEAQLLPQQVQRLKFLVRKFVEDLTEAHKVFVWKRNTPMIEEEARSLHAALNLYGPNTLLWVVPADIAHPVGSLEQIAPGLLCGRIDRFAPYQNAHDLTLDLWLDLCVKAHRYQAQRAREPADV